MTGKKSLQVCLAVLIFAKINFDLTHSYLEQHHERSQRVLAHHFPACRVVGDEHGEIALDLSSGWLLERVRGKVSLHLSACRIVGSVG